jgi:hypothetical protein
MALSDYIPEKTEEKVAIPFASPAMADQSANALTMADIQMATAEKMAQNRARAEELKKKIANLRAQNDQLRARRDQIKANSLSDMDEDKVVAMAKAKGIKDSDIETWLRGRTARTNREISLGQKASLEAQEREMAEANRQNAEQAIFDAQAELVAAEKAVPDEQLRAQDAIVKAKRNKFERLKRDYEKAYKVHWEDVSGKDGKTDDPDEKGPQNAQEGPKNVVVELTDEQIGVLDEPTLAKYNEPTATNETKRKIKAEADKKIREKNEADERRRQQIESVKGDLATIGAKSGMDAAKIVNGFDKSADRNDPVKRAAVARLKNFVGKDKEFKTYKSLDKLMK